MQSAISTKLKLFQQIQKLKTIPAGMKEEYFIFPKSNIFSSYLKNSTLYLKVKI